MEDSGDLIALPALLILIALLAVGVNIGFIDLADRVEALRPIQCLVELFSVSEGVKDASFCPVSGRAFAAREEDGWRAVACPDPGVHLRHELKLLRKGASRRIALTLPGSTERPAWPLRLTTFLKSTLIEENPEEILVTFSDRPLSRFLLCPLILLVAMPLAGLYVFRTLRRNRARRSLGGDLILAGLIAASVVAIWQAGRRMAHVRQAAISRRDGAVTLRDFYFGRTWADPERLADPRVVFPVPTVGGTYLAVLIHMEDGRPKPKILFKAEAQDAGMVSALNAALGPGSL